MLCPICKKEINNQSIYCEKCGEKIPRCPKCGKVIYKKALFCVYDGTAIPQEMVALLPNDQNGAGAAKQATVHTVEKNIPQSEENRKKKKSPVVPIIIGVLLALIIVLAGVFGYMAYSGNLSFITDRFTESSRAEDDEDEDDRDDEDADDVVDRSAVDDDEEDADDESALEEEDFEFREHKEDPYAPGDEEEAAEENNETFMEEEEDPLTYFIMNCDREYFSESDLETFDAEMCRIARNGIYARMGRKFEDEGLREYFEQFEWYNPVIEAEDFSESLLNDYQIANRDLIVAYEEEQGYR